MCFITGGDAGSKNDPAVIADNDVNGILHAAWRANGDEVVYLADAAFGLSNNILDELLNEQFLHNKLEQTRPVRAMRISALLRNVFRCMSACNASTYFDVFPPTLREYLSWV